MSRSKPLIALAAASTVAGRVANASGTPFASLVPPPWTAGQLKDDPTLVNCWTFDILVVVSSATGQDRWASADLHATLPAGSSFYIPPSEDSNRLQIPTIRNATGSRYLQ